MTKGLEMGGVLKILRFNWPWYALTGGGLLLLPLLLNTLSASPRIQGIAKGGMALAFFWMVASLIVAHVIYDRTGLTHGAWLKGLPVNDFERVMVIHAGHDEATEGLARHCPHANVLRYDAFSSGKGVAPSLLRARREASPNVFAVNPGKLPCPDGSMDLIWPQELELSWWSSSAMGGISLPMGPWCSIS